MHKLLALIVRKLNRKWQNILAVIFFNYQQKNNKFKSSEIEFFKLPEWVKNGYTVIDVGSNVGRYTFKLAKLVGKTGQVYSFEPLPSSFFILTCLNFLGNYNNITLLNCAVGEKSSKINFEENWYEPVKNSYIFHTNTGSRVSESKTGINSIDRHQLALDDLLIQEKVNFIKIDVEGYEASVIKGAKNLILRDKPTVLIEWVHTLDAEQIKEFFRNIGYKFIQCDVNSRNIVFFIDKN